MLPTGHIAAGYLTAYALLKITHPEITPNESHLLLGWGMFCAFAPDMDEFWFFYKTKGLLVSPDVEKSHRDYWSHAPIFWLVAGVLVYFIAESAFWKSAGLILWIGAWSHFLLDSVEYGIAWLKPWKSKLYSVRNAGVNFKILEKDFLRHSFKFLYFYARTWTFKIEICILLAALIVFIKL